MIKALKKWKSNNFRIRKDATRETLPFLLPSPFFLLSNPKNLTQTYRWQIILSLFAAVCTILAGIGLMASSGYLISRAALRPPILDLMLIIVAVRFFALSRAAFRYLERLVSHDLTFKWLMALRMHLYGVLEPLMPGLLLRKTSGDLLGRLVADIDTLQNLYLRVVAPAMTAVIVVAITVVALSFFSPLIAWTAFGFLALNGMVVPWIATRRARGLGREQVLARSELQAALVEDLQGLRDLLLFGADEKSRLLMYHRSLRLGHLQERQAAITGLQDALSHLCAHLGMWTVLLLAIPLVASGALDGVYLALLVLSVLTSFEAVQSLGAAFQFHEQTRTAFSRLDALHREPLPIRVSEAPSGLDLGLGHFSQRRKGSKAPPLGFLSGLGVFARAFFGRNDDQHPPSAIDQAGPSPVHQGVPGDIRFERVTFAYESEPAISDLSFSLSPGAHIAVVGPSGAGKSTIAHLLLRFRDPTQGKITWNNRDLCEYTQEEILAHIAVVPQHIHLFNKTLRENLRLAHAEASDDMLWAVLEQAQLADWVRRLPEGLDTFIGEQGARLSGGERQRVAIARAFLKNAPILLLDEPTAHLDADTEGRIINALLAFSETRSLLWITHRLIRLEAMHRILVLDRGRLIENDTHTRLLEANGLYARMLRQQNQVLGLL